MFDLVGAETFAAEVADGARAIALHHFRSEMSVDFKSDKSPVTVADRAIESHMRAEIAKRYPEHGIFGEEEAPINTDRKLVWVIDPIDGTKSYVTGHPIFGGLMGLLDDGVPCLGQIDMPVLKERFVAARDRKTTLNGTPCKTRDCTRVEDAVSYTTDPILFSGPRQGALDLLRDESLLVRFGGDCYCYALLATGHCDIVLETGLAPYDYLPVVPIVEGAGGVITDWRGHALGIASSGDVLAAATPELHAALLERLRDRSADQAA